MVMMTLAPDTPRFSKEENALRWVVLEERTRKGRAVITPDDCDTPAPLGGSPNCAT